MSILDDNTPIGYGNENSTEGDSLELSKQLGESEDYYASLRQSINTFLQDNKVDKETRNRLLLLPDLFYLLVRLVLDPRVPIAHKFELIVAITYVISPIDLIPDFLSPIGWVDDLFVVAMVLSSILSITGKVEEDIIVEHWNGEKDDLMNVRRIASQGSDFFNKLGLLKQFEAFFGKLRK